MTAEELTEEIRAEITDKARWIVDVYTNTESITLTERDRLVAAMAIEAGQAAAIVVLHQRGMLVGLGEATT